MDSGILIPITLFITVAAVLIVAIVLGHKSKASVQETIRQSIEQGHQITPELLAKLGSTHSPKVKDLRRGIVIFSLGLAAMAAGLIVNDPDATVGIMMIGVFPLFIGAGFLLVWKLNRYND
ncbi:MAG: hypothetical protein HWE27_08895 [Gammaproteobacteria bacterium]|nr:hypothetical protein [Gammaproteobacteria bacterium]